MAVASVTELPCGVVGSSRPAPVRASRAKAKRRMGSGPMRGASRAPHWAASTTGRAQYSAVSTIVNRSSPRVDCRPMRTSVLSTNTVSSVERMRMEVQGCR